MLEYLGGATAIVAAIGYCSLRAHLNHLGIAGIASLPTSLYLYEAYLFLSAWIAVVIDVAVPVLLLVCCGALVVRRLQWTHRVCALAAKPWCRCAFLASYLLASPLLLVAGLSLLPGANLAGLMATTGPAPAETARPSIFALTVVLTLLASLIPASELVYQHAAREVGNLLAYGQRLLGIAVASVLLWMSVVVFNTTPPAEPSYPVVRLYDKTNAVLSCGLLVLATDGQYVIWELSLVNEGWNLSVWPKSMFRQATVTGRETLGKFNNEEYRNVCVFPKSSAR